jgi:DNA-binding CsgD family transcriptional regulator
LDPRDADPSHNLLTAVVVGRRFRTRDLDASRVYGEAAVVAIGESKLVSMGGCIASALTVSRRRRWWGAVLGAVSSREDELWARWRRGESLRLIARRLGKRGPSVRAFVLHSGGVQHCPARRAERCLSLAEREEISRGVAAGEPCRQIAARLGRAPRRGRGS